MGKAFFVDFRCCSSFVFFNEKKPWRIFPVKHLPSKQLELPGDEAEEAPEAGLAGMEVFVELSLDGQTFTEDADIAGSMLDQRL